MKINSSKSKTKRNIILAITACVVIALGILGYFYLNRQQDSTTTNPGINSIDYGKATNDQINNGNNIKSNSLNKSGSDQPSTPTPIPDSTKKSVQVTITAANQNGSTLQIRALIGAVDDTGTCTLTLSQTGKTTVTKTAGTQALASTSTCQGFDVPLSELSSGIWKAMISYDSPTLTGSVTQDVPI